MPFYQYIAEITKNGMINVIGDGDTATACPNGTLWLTHYHSSLRGSLFHTRLHALPRCDGAGHPLGANLLLERALPGVQARWRIIAGGRALGDSGPEGAGEHLAAH